MKGRKQHIGALWVAAASLVCLLLPASLLETGQKPEPFIPDLPEMPFCTILERGIGPGGHSDRLATLYRLGRYEICQWRVEEEGAILTGPFCKTGFLSHRLFGGDKKKPASFQDVEGASAEAFWAEDEKRLDALCAEIFPDSDGVRRLILDLREERAQL